MTPDHLAALVADAVGHALDRRHRQMVREAATAALIIALVVVLPLTLLQNAAASDAARLNSVRNCTVIRSLEGIVGQVLSSDTPIHPGEKPLIVQLAALERQDCTGLLR